jgi:hypothetical protein
MNGAIVSVEKIKFFKLSVATNAKFHSEIPEIIFYLGFQLV